MVDKEIGYIKVTRFAATTYDEFRKSIADLQAKGMKKLIVDLQGNPGGYMGAAIYMVAPIQIPPAMERARSKGRRI